jgi:hypothetical protein
VRGGGCRDVLVDRDGEQVKLAHNRERNGRLRARPRRRQPVDRRRHLLDGSLKGLLGIARGHDSGRGDRLEPPREVRERLLNVELQRTRLGQLARRALERPLGHLDAPAKPLENLDVARVLVVRIARARLSEHREHALLLLQQRDALRIPAARAGGGEDGEGRGQRVAPARS